MKKLFFIATFVIVCSLLVVGQQTVLAGDYKLAWYAPAPHPYFELVKQGVEEFEKEYGIEVIKEIGPDWSQSSQAERVEALGAKGAKGFSIFPSDPSAANGMYEELNGRGIYVISFGAKTLDPTTASFYVGTHIKQAAMDATEYLIKQMGGKGSILNVLGVIEDYNTTLRNEGVHEVADQYPDVEIISEISGMTTPEIALEKVENALAAHINEIDGIVSTETNGTEAVSRLLTEYHEKGNRWIHFIGIDNEPEVMKALKGGYIDATMAQNPFGHGYIPMVLLKYLKDGWTPKEYFVEAGHMPVTKDNVDTYEADVMQMTKEIVSLIESRYLNPPKK